MLAHSPQSSQCCLKTSETTLYGTNYYCNVDPKRTVIFSLEDNYKMLSESAWTNIAQENYLCSGDSQSTDNLAQEVNLQFCLDLSERTLHKETTIAMLAYG